MAARAHLCPCVAIGMKCDLSNSCRLATRAETMRRRSLREQRSVRCSCRMRAAQPLIRQLVEDVRAGRRSIQEITSQHLAAIASLEPKIKSFITVDAENAMQQVRPAGWLTALPSSNGMRCMDCMLVSVHAAACSVALSLGRRDAYTAAWELTSEMPALNRLASVLYLHCMSWESRRCDACQAHPACISGRRPRGLTTEHASMERRHLGPWQACHWPSRHAHDIALGGL